MNLAVSSDIVVSDFADGDKAALLEHLKEREIYERTAVIPYPYTESDADWWLNHVREETARLGRSVNWAIRRGDGFLIGSIGFHEFQPGKSHAAAAGYWLAKPYWGKGIMTEVVRAVTGYAHREFDLVRVSAHVFDFNRASARVLEKSGYRYEGRMVKYARKDGRFFDGLLYAHVL